MRYLLCLVLLAVTCVAPVGAQTVDTVMLGTVVDPGSAPVAGVTVTVTQPSTGLSHTATTSPEGAYEIRYLVPGEYVVEIHAAGFRGERRTGVVIQLGQQARLDFTLQVGAVQETVEVNAGVPLLQTENATLAGVVDQERVVVKSDEVRDRRQQVPVGERDVRGVADREQPEDTEDEEEGGDEEVRRELRVEPTEELAARAGRGDDLVWTSRSGYGAHDLLVIVSSRAVGVEGAPTARPGSAEGGFSA